MDAEQPLLVANDGIEHPYEDDDETDWEEVDVDQQHQQPQQHLEITLNLGPKASDKAAAKKKGLSHAERLLRIDCHKIHTICLLANAWTRNCWLNDELLHARLLSLTPMNLQNGFAMIHKNRVPDPSQRGRMFELAMVGLVEWWSEEFFEVVTEGHIRNHTFDEVQNVLLAEGHVTPSSLPEEGADTDAANQALKIEDAEPIGLLALQDVLDDDGEQIRTPNSLMKRALVGNGSRDISSQLFIALCRALGIPTRLVVSLQSVPWQASIGKPKPTYTRHKKGKGKAKQDGTTDVGSSAPGSTRTSPGLPPDGDTLNGAEAVKRKEPSRVKLRKTKVKGQKLGSSIPDPGSPTSKVLPALDPRDSPPVFWAEVFSRADGRWLPVDPIRGIVNKRKTFDPSPQPIAAPAQSASSHPLFTSVNAGKSKVVRGPQRKQENRMLYVVAFEEDGYIKDVTRRYARDFGTKIAKAQGGTGGVAVKGGALSRKVWWSHVVGLLTRPYRLARDDVEDTELDSNEMSEGMPTTLSGFKDHPLYVLVKHLKQNETIFPPPPETPQIGKFRGDPVYPRSSVVSLKTAENWIRTEGRTVKPGSQPLKMTKIRAGTVSKQRELEVLKERTEGDAENASANGDGGSAAMQGLYARNQTELFVPAPVVDGKVPKNNFGNVDLYVPSMLPAGAAHIPFKGIAKIARKLGYDHAEAVTGFEFKKRRAFPIIEGIVIAQENEAPVIEAYLEAEREAQEKAEAKRYDQAVKRWTRLMHGLLIRERLQKQYASNGQSSEAKKDNVADDQALEGAAHPENPSGGFLVGADDVVQRFKLPKDFQVSYPPSKPESVTANTPTRASSPQHEEEPPYDAQIMDLDLDLDNDDPPHDLPAAVVPLSQPSTTSFVPRTLEELAESVHTMPAVLYSHLAEEILPIRGETEASAPPVSLPTKRKGKAAFSASRNGKTTPGRKQGTTKSTRGRVRSRNPRRARGDPSLSQVEDDSQSEVELTPSESSEGSDEEEDLEPAAAAANGNTKKRKASSRPLRPRNSAVTVAPSDRVLRSRASRTNAPS